MRESKDRVRGALISSGFDFPQQRITVSLGPADMPKAGGRYDLAIALGILAARKQFSIDALAQLELYGELALSGELRSVPGILPAALSARVSQRAIVVPIENRSEAAVTGADVYPAGSLLEVTAHLAGRKTIQPYTESPGSYSPPPQYDLADVKGQSRAKRALEIAAAGGHNLLLIGPPGTGKSMLARRLPGLLPALSKKEAIETAAINSVLGIPLAAASWRRRPFRAPHHTATAPALVGGGKGPRPGEVSRAHNGVLFLDELPEFTRKVLDVLPAPIETAPITITRAGGQAHVPARHHLVAAMTPCFSRATNKLPTRSGPRS